MTGTAVTVLPADFALPAHLQTPEAVAAIAAANAAAAGGIKIGSFPSISIKGAKFHIKANGETKLLTAPPPRDANGTEIPGSPVLPLMCLRAVVVDANPAVSKLYYADKYVEGEDREPTCSSGNGVVPDNHIVNKQAALCASCPQNAWGSKISEFSGKEVKACTDVKNLVILSADDLDYQALQLTVTASSLGEWGKYVKALTDRNTPVSGVITNITFDATVSYPKLNFSYGGFLSPEAYAKAQARAAGDDVKAISRPAQRAATVPALPPANHPVLAAPHTVALPAAAEAVIAADPYAGQPPHVKQAVDACSGPTTPAGAATYKALTGKDYVAPVVAAAPSPILPKPVDPYEGQPAHVKLAVEGAGGLASAPGAMTYKALTGKDAPTAPAAALPVVPAQPAAEPAKRVRAPRKLAEPVPPVQQTGSVDLSHLTPTIRAAVEAVGADSPAGQALLAQFPPPAVQPAATPAANANASAPPQVPAAAQTGFGAAGIHPPGTPAPVVVPAAVSASAASLQDILAKKLGTTPGA